MAEREFSVAGRSMHIGPRYVDPQFIGEGESWNRRLATAFVCLSHREHCCGRSRLAEGCSLIPRGQLAMRSMLATQRSLCPLSAVKFFISLNGLLPPCFA